MSPSKARRPAVPLLALASIVGAARCGAFVPPRGVSIPPPGGATGRPRALVPPRALPPGLPSDVPSLDVASAAVAAVVAAAPPPSSTAGGMSVYSLLHAPTLWSVLAMTSIVALLVAWEEAVENIKHNTPKPILPVIDSMLAEVGGLGFIGLFLSTVVTGGPLGQVVGGLSEEFLGDEELLLETFEFLHTFFFEVGILFFAIAGVVVGAVLAEVRKLEEISEMKLDADGDGEVTLDELADALEVDSVVVDLDGDGVITDEEKVEALRAASRSEDRSALSTLSREYAMSSTDRAGEQLVTMERMMEQLGLRRTFAIDEYFAKVFGENLEEVVELSPVTWLPLIPLIAIDNSVDLMRDVVSASSSNAFDSCGCFLATPWVLYSTLLLQALSLVWAVFNSWKVGSVKRMLLPTLVRENADSEAVLLPPRYLDPLLLSEFDSSPGAFAMAERLFAGGGSATPPPRNAHEELFGAAGSEFAGAYRNSIRFHTWLCVAQIVYSTTQIVFRDAAALYLGATTGNPDAVLAELVVWSAFVASAIFQLSLAPTTFLNYCYVTNVEEYVKRGVVNECILDEEERDCVAEYALAGERNAV